MGDRATYLLVSQMHDLQHACKIISAAFPPWGVYHVGSSLERADYRDVDLRCILEDDEYDKFIGTNTRRLNFLNACISQWIARNTGLPIDFQFQRQTQANEEYGRGKGCRRHAIGFPMPEDMPG